MSSLALMRLLESAPDRYDRGMRWLTLGRVDAVREALADAVVSKEAPSILELGCGTGSLTAALVARGARVTALDQSPEMLERARERLRDAPHCELLERTASEIDGLPDASFDGVAAAFCLSEMSTSERAHVLRQAAAKVRHGGCVAIADEGLPRRRLARWLAALLRAPQAAVAWGVVGSVSRPLPDLEGELRAAGLRVRARREWLGGHLTLCVAERSS